MAWIDDVPATQNFLHDDEKDDVDVEGAPSKRLVVTLRDAVTKWSPSSPSPDGSDTDGDTSVASLHEKPVDRRAMRRVMMKEFFVRAFLAKHYDLPSLYSTYEALMRLVTVEVYRTHEAVWQVR